MFVFLLLLPTIAALDFTGYVVDSYCWDKPATGSFPAHTAPPPGCIDVCLLISSKILFDIIYISFLSFTIPNYTHLTQQPSMHQPYVCPFFFWSPSYFSLFFGKYFRKKIKRIKRIKRTQLTTSPFLHTVECIRDVSVCLAKMVMLEKDSITQKYAQKYTFDATATTSLQQLICANTQDVTDSSKLLAADSCNPSTC